MPTSNVADALAGCQLEAEVTVSDGGTFPKSHFEPMHVKSLPLFGSGNRPEPHHILQNSINNCYLLTGVVSLLTKPYGAKWIERITFLGQTTVGDEVKVRLFCPPRGGVTLPAEPPRYVVYSVKPTAPHEFEVAYDAQTDRFAVERFAKHATYKTKRGAVPWVVLLEKAYAAHRARYGTGLGFTPKPGVDCQKYSTAIEFGLPTDALGAILGPVSRVFWMYALPSIPTNGTTLGAKLASELSHQNSELFTRLNNELRRIALSRGGFLQRFVGMCLGMETKANLLEAFFDGTYPTTKANAPLKRGKDPDRTMIRWEEVWSIVDPGPASGMRKEILDDVQRWLQTVYPGKRGTGVYASAMLAKWERIRRILDSSNTMMTAWTSFPRTGIIPMHEYSVVGASTVNDTHFVHLANPKSDRSGRVYKLKSMRPVSLSPAPHKLTKEEVAVSTTNGVFEVELGDFLKSFHVREMARGSLHAG